MGLLDRTNLVSVKDGEYYSDTRKTVQDWIDRADKREDDTFELQTEDGFKVFERCYKNKPDGTKELICKHYLKENELTPREAVEAMLNKENLVDFENPADIAQYKWNGENFIKYDSYIYENKEVITKFTGLQRKTENKELEAKREKIRVKEILGFDLDLTGLPQVSKRCGLSGAMYQALSMCRAQNWEINETHVYSVLANLDSDLESEFPSYDYNAQKKQQRLNRRQRKLQRSQQLKRKPLQKQKRH